MHSNSFLLLTFGLLLATASIFAAPPPLQDSRPSTPPGPPPEHASNVVPVSQEPLRFTKYNLNLNIPGNRLVQAQVTNHFPRKFHKQYVAEIVNYMKAHAGNSEHPVYTSNIVKVSTPEAARFTLPPGTKYTALFSTKNTLVKQDGTFYFKKERGMDGFGHFLDKPKEGTVEFHRPGDVPPGESSSSEIHHYPLPTPDDIRSIDYIPKREPKNPGRPPQQFAVGGRRGRDSDRYRDDRSRRGRNDDRYRDDRTPPRRYDDRYSRDDRSRRGRNDDRYRDDRTRSQSPPRRRNDDRYPDDRPPYRPGQTPPPRRNDDRYPDDRSRGRNDAGPSDRNTQRRSDSPGPSDRSRYDNRPRRF